jgi:hypothetical protein
MNWASQKPESFMDFARGRFMALVLMAAVLAGGFTVLNRSAKKPENQRKAPTARPSPEKEPAGGIFIDEPAEGVPDSPVAKEAPGPETKKSQAAKKESEKDADSPSFKQERTLLTHPEAMAHKFKEPLPDFEPLETLDYKDDSFHELYALVMDEDVRTVYGRRKAGDYAYAAEIMYLYFRFLRTHADHPEKIEAYYEKRKAELTQIMGGPRQAEANYANVMKNHLLVDGSNAHLPYRGQLYHFHGLLMQKYQIRVWSKDEDNNSGVQETWLLVCRDLKYRDHLYGVLVPHSARHLRSRDEVDNADLVAWKGLFLQRWPYEQKDQRGGAMPLYVAWTADRIKQPPSNRGTNWVLVAVGTVLCLALIYVFWQTSRDDKRLDSFRRNMRRKPGTGKKKTADDPDSSESPAAPAAPEPATEPSAAEPPKSDFEAPQD